MKKTENFMQQRYPKKKKRPEVEALVKREYRLIG